MGRVVLKSLEEVSDRGAFVAALEHRSKQWESFRRDLLVRQDTLKLSSGFRSLCEFFIIVFNRRFSLTSRT